MAGIRRRHEGLPRVRVGRAPSGEAGGVTSSVFLRESWVATAGGVGVRDRCPAPTRATFARRPSSRASDGGRGCSSGEGVGCAAGCAAAASDGAASSQPSARSSVFAPTLRSASCTRRRLNPIPSSSCSASASWRPASAAARVLEAGESRRRRHRSHGASAPSIPPPALHRTQGELIGRGDSHPDLDVFTHVVMVNEREKKTLGEGWTERERF